MTHCTWTVRKKSRLDLFLRDMIPSVLNDGTDAVSNSKIRRLIMAGVISVNGKQCRVPAFDLHSGSLVEAFIDEAKFFYEKRPDDIAFTLESENVLYEDDSLIVVNKPAFFPTEETIVKGRGNMHQAIIDYLWKKNPSLRNPPYVGIMHRLDRETSGVLLFTKTRAVNKAVHDAFESRLVSKEYRAVCSVSAGKEHSFVFGKKTFTVECSIGRVSPSSQACKMGIVPEQRGGQYSKTVFTLAAEQDGLYYVDCKLFTGRTHQIRVHLSHSGLPIVGDNLYGGTNGILELGNRIMLHSAKLSIPHPVTGELLEVTAPLPQGFAPGII